MALAAGDAAGLAELIGLEDGIAGDVLAVGDEPGVGEAAGVAPGLAPGVGETIATTGGTSFISSRRRPLWVLPLCA